MNQDKAFQKGKIEMRWLGIFLLVLNFMILISELLLWRSVAMLIIEIVVSGACSALVIAAISGRKVRWPLFGMLFVTSMFTFYLAGSRMALSSKVELTFPVLVTLLPALAFLLSGLYLGYSVEIGAFLKKHKNIDPTEN